MSGLLGVGMFGAVVLVIGSAYPIKKTLHPAKSAKNWLFAIGGALMLTYSILNFLYGTGAVFFIFLQGLVNVASLFMLTNAPERISTPIIAGLAVLLIMWSLSLFQTTSNLFFIIGLSGIALGYVLKPGTSRRNLSLCLGSILIAIFSYFSADWVFFWLNAFFATFSGYYFVKLKKAEQQVMKHKA